MRQRGALLLLLATLTAGCGAAERGQAGGVSLLQPGDGAPTFTLPSAEGNPVALSDFRGKPTLLYFSMGPG
jgi:cytochrome oxidase Cu insertion factor (SCO1/SenC/PrrC family)